MSQATPELLVTDAGLAAASVATPTGPYIHIVGFKVGSAFGYDPDRTQTGLKGQILYSGQVLSWNSIGDNTLDVVLRIPPEAGPFQFGEVGVYLADANGQFSDQSPLFAVAVFDDVQTKFSSLGTNVVSSYTFHCLLRLEQSVAVFQIDTLSGEPSVVDVYCWSDIYPPGVSANPDVPMYVCRELNSPAGDASLLSNASDKQWTLNGGPYYLYRRIRDDSALFQVANASNSWVEVVASDLKSNDLTTANRRFVIRTADGFFRSVSSVVDAQNGNYRFNLNVSNDGTYNNYPLPNVPALGSNISIYRDDMAAMGKVYWEQVIGGPAPPSVAINGVPGLATSGDGTTIQVPGEIAAYGLLHSPSQNTGRLMTGVDDLNSTIVNSGVYWSISEIYGAPANSPVPGNISNYTLYHINNGNAQSQLAIAYDTSPPSLWFRATQNGTSDWSAWQQSGRPATTSFLTLQNGLAIFDGGLWLQWGVVSAGASVQTQITFPQGFPNACLSMQVTVHGDGASWPQENHSLVVRFNQTGATIGTDQLGSYWFAIGY